MAQSLAAGITTVAWQMATLSTPHRQTDNMAIIEAQETLAA
jgi:hypothetical protein